MTLFTFEDEVVAKGGERLVILPEGLKDKKTLLGFLREAIPLPPYFGGNWDALEECLSDLAWLPDEQLALVHRDVPLGAIPSDQKIYLQILAAAMRGETSLRVVFSKKSRAEVLRILATT